MAAVLKTQCLLGKASRAPFTPPTLRTLQHPAPPLPHLPEPPTPHHAPPCRTCHPTTLPHVLGTSPTPLHALLTMKTQAAHSAILPLLR